MFLGSASKARANLPVLAKVRLKQWLGVEAAHDQERLEGNNPENELRHLAQNTRGSSR
jgi:hypothetical protein